MNTFKDSGHIFRLGAVFVAGTLLFLGARSFLVPKSFGQLGHYRAAAIGEIASHPVKFAGHETCEACHTDVVEKKSAGKHAHVNCEACHGPQSAHADDPGSGLPPKLEATKLCPQCHEENAAKPKGFPQVASEEHSSGLPCDGCHQPHSPVISAKENQ